MNINLPKIGKPAIPFLHFPTKHQAFIFRAYEYVSPEAIAELIHATPDQIRAAALEMGLTKECTDNVWLEKGYITIIRKLWHILPYDQLLSLLQMDEETLAVILREEDFLDIKLGNKPACDPVIYRELTEEEQEQTAWIRQIVSAQNIGGTEAFDFHYDVKDMKLSGNQLADLRMVYGFSGLYQHAFDVDSRTYCPDEMLEAYRKVGINAIWTQGVLFQLAEFPFHKELSKGYKERLDRLKDLTERCDRYGIKIFLYMNEPRSMPENFYEKYPHIKGHNAKDDKVCLCTSTKEVQAYITDSIESICRAVPKIGGFFTITRSENPTNCYSHSTRYGNSTAYGGSVKCTCPRCSQRNESEVIAEVIGCIEKGAHKVNPDIKVIAWSWGWDSLNVDIINALPDNVAVMSQSELRVPFNRGGVNAEVRDYSMSVLGPGERALTEWKAARERGLETAVKMQINTTWEGSTVPALPVYPLIEEHIRRVQAEGVTNFMLSWTLGGMPSRNIMHVSKYFFENYDKDALQETEVQKCATQLFSEAFQEFPFHITVLYQGPQNAGPGNLLYLNPTGYTATMTCYAYDDIESWRAVYPREVFDSQLDKLCAKWNEGLKILEEERIAKDLVEITGETEIMANAAYCLFKSSLNQFRFYVARDAADKAAMIAAAKEELEISEKMLHLMTLDASIGFEAANHYYYSKGCLLEKILNCHDVIRRLQD